MNKRQIFSSKFPTHDNVDLQVLKKRFADVNASVKLVFYKNQNKTISGSGWGED